ncbi:hypothetical protein EB796_012844 [Bugula neritina]|uniref:THADA n=1 Tax=Bugula neritina TaxID=10212 RepID=A0A7J7JR74_BUGNE|nr:hypothetical protein EB796_012844 [Bugula neritina]
MEPIEEFIIFSESGDRLKEICKRLLEVCKEDESLLARSVLRLIPAVNSSISVTVLNKLIFVWENFTVLQSCDEVPLLLELIRTVLHSYIEECVLPHNAGSANSGYNIDESLTRSQRALRLMISVCQFGRHLDESRLSEIACLLQTILFPTSAECSEHIEVSALAGTALCNLIILRETDLFVEYQKLCPPDVELRFGHIAMISGILSISKGLGEQETHSLAPALMSNILKMCYDDLNTYHSFSCLLKFLRSHLFVDLLNADTDSVQKSIVHLLWLKIDSPVKGVSELVSSCLQVLLRVCHKHVKGCVPLHQQLIERVPVTGCHVRSHLKILAVLLPWINLEDFLTTSPHFITKLAHCMSVQHMVSAAAKVYSALIEKTTLLLWQQLVMRAFIQALTSKVKLTRNNVKEYWLPTTLTKLPKAGEVLMLELRNSTDCSQGVLDVYAACRYRAIQVQLPVTLLESSLVSGNDEVRLAAIEVICKPPQTASATVNEEEIHLLERYLAYNLNIDCPSFRRCIKASINSHIDRSCHIVTNSKDANAVEYIVNHLSWLWQLLRESLVRGSNYQRKETVMDLCISFVKKLSKLYQELSLSDKQSLLHSVTCEEKPRCTRGHCSCSLSQFKSRVVKVCLLDSSSQIQDLGLKFLTLHVSKGFQTTWGDDNSYILDNLSLWTKYITSAKASEAESGAKLYTLIVSKAMKEPHKFFNEDVIGQIEQVISLAEKDHTSIVTSLHVHGYLIAVRQVLRHTPYLSTLNNTQLALLGKRLISVCHRSATLVLEILSAACDNKEVSPSFEQMEVAVNELIERALGGPVLDISELSERVTAWCWLTLKEACSLCGAITLSSEKYKDLLTQTAADTIRSIFFSTLTKCRHRGVIEGSCEGLLDFCAVMRRSGDRGLSSLPSSIINQVLDMSVRSEDSASGCSVTRRSGGFPLIIQNVLASHPSNKQAISTVVDELLHLTHDIASAQKDDTTDMSQVHAFNILKALVTDARLLYTMRSYLARVTIKSIQAFSSPVWALRNAATQLFAACSLRMLGQRGEAEHRSAGTGSAEFFSQYPLLYTYLKEELRGSNSCRRPAQLYPLLSLVSRLSSPIHHVTESNTWLILHVCRTMKPFREDILRLFGHPLYGVRVMLPHCVIATVDTLHEMVDLCSALFSFLNATAADANLLSYLSSSASSTSDTSARLRLLRVLLRRTRLFLLSAICPPIRLTQFWLQFMR